MSKTPKRLELEKEYRRLAKRADQRLVRLEQLAEQTEYKGIKEFAYKRAQRDIRAWSGENANRFNTKPPSNTNKLKAKIADIKRFLESASSTIGATKETRGIKQIYQDRAATINERYDTNFNWKDLARLFESGIWKKIKSSDSYDSKTDFQTIANMKANFKEVKQAIRNDQEVNIDTLDEVENFAINEIINTYGGEILKVLT